MSNNTSDLDFDNFLEQGLSVFTDYEEFVGGLSIPKQTLVARLTGGVDVGKITPYESGGSNGVNVPIGITVDPVDTTGSNPVHHPIYKNAYFNANKLNFVGSGDSLTVALVDVLASKGLYARKWVFNS